MRWAIVWAPLQAVLLLATKCRIRGAMRPRRPRDAAAKCSPRRPLSAFFIPQHEQVKSFHLRTSPGRTAKKFQAGADAGVVREAAHRDLDAKLGPPVMRFQGANNRLQRDAVQAIARLGGVGWGVVHGKSLSA